MKIPSLPPKEDGVLVFALAAAAAFFGWLFGWNSIVWQNLILFSAALIAVLALRASRRTERQKATLVLLHEYDNSEAVKKGVEVLNKRKDNQSPFDEAERVAVRDFLNHLELLAIGLKNGIYDEKMVRDAMETAIVRHYKRAEIFIRKARAQDGDVREVAYEHFEALALKILGRLKKPQ